MSEQVPSIGRIVHYRLSAQDAKAINACRLNSLNTKLSGNPVCEGDTYPMIIVRVWGDKHNSAVNGQVMLDGNDLFWATSVLVGDGPRSFSWPPRV